MPDGKWAKGHAGGPGRPPGFRGVAKRIMKETRNGDELVEWALSVWRDETLPMSERWRAHDWLSDRGLGKPITVAHVTMESEHPDNITPAEMAEFERLLALCRRDGTPPGTALQ